MKDTWRNLFIWRFWRGKAKDIRVANWLGAQTCAQGIANHSTDSGIGPTIGFNCRRSIVSLYLEGDVVVFGEFDDSCIVFENAYTPVILAEISANLLCCFKNRLFNSELTNKCFL